MCAGGVSTNIHIRNSQPQAVFLFLCFTLLYILLHQEAEAEFKQAGPNSNQHINQKRTKQTQHNKEDKKRKCKRKLQFSI